MLDARSKFRPADSFPVIAFNPLGSKGVAEIALTGVAPAIANAVYHATGRRVRNLPITPEKLVDQELAQAA